MLSCADLVALVEAAGLDQVGEDQAALRALLDGLGGFDIVDWLRARRDVTLGGSAIGVRCLTSAGRGGSVESRRASRRRVGCARPPFAA